MSYTVWGAFNEFREKVIDLDAEKTKTARRSRDYLFEQIERLAEEDLFPKLYGSYLSFGSFARRTKIRPLDDIDVLILLDGYGTKDTAPSPYASWLKITDQSSPLAEYSDEYGYVNSTKVLNRMKSALMGVPNYRKAEIHKNMQAVTLDLISYPWTFDVVPAVPISDVYDNISHYVIPDGHSNWLRTDPRIDQENITDTNKQHHQKFLPTVRLLKYWNRRTHKPRLESYYFETLSIKVFRQLSAISGFPTAIKAFFDYFPHYLFRSCSDPKGLGPNLDAEVSSETKRKISKAVSKALEYAKYAMMYERQENDEKAIYWWGRLFGSEFPEYG